MSFLSRTTLFFCQGLLLAFCQGQLLLFVRDYYYFVAKSTVGVCQGRLYFLFVREHYNCFFCQGQLPLFCRGQLLLFLPGTTITIFVRDSCLLCRLPCTNTPSTFRRRSVSQTIVDPHLKRDGSYNVHTEAQAAGVYVQNKDGGEFDGWCWPGSSSYVDFTNPKGKGALSGT